MFTIFQYMKLSCQAVYQQQTIRNWNKQKTIPFTIASQKDKTLRNKLRKVLKDLMQNL